MDNRITERTAQEVEVHTVLLTQDAEGNWVPGERSAYRTLDVSDGGVSLHTNTEYPDGQPMLILMRKSGSGVCQFGRVVHARPASAGGFAVGIRYYPTPLELEEAAFFPEASDAA
ncbi:MAG: PilZ domain-containing protein [Planctomycetota bacterium]